MNTHLLLEIKIVHIGISRMVLKKVVKMYQFTKKLQEFRHFGLVQIIDNPTRGDNILDLMITSNPTNINRTEIIPGISTMTVAIQNLSYISPIKNK